MEKSAQKFQKLKHRIEFVSRIKKRDFYNDSKATNAHSVIYALEKFSSNVILIAGGEDKGFSFDIWKKEFKNKVNLFF